MYSQLKLHLSIFCFVLLILNEMTTCSVKCVTTGNWHIAPKWQTEKMSDKLVKKWRI